MNLPTALVVIAAIAAAVTLVVLGHGAAVFWLAVVFFVFWY